MGLLEGKVVFITGGGRGQGRAHAVVSAREGADIVIVDTSKPINGVIFPHTTTDDIAETVELVEKEGRRALAFDADVRDQAALDDAVAEAIGELGQIDTLIANAGILTMRPITELSIELWQDMIDINLTGVFKSVRAVMPHMIERQTGTMVLVSSMNGIEGAPDYAHYAAAKFGVVGLMKSLAMALGPEGIRVNAIHPGAVRSGMTDNQEMYDMFAGGSGGTHEHFVEAGRHFGLLKGTTFMEPEAMANAALYLNSELASHVTGIQLPVDSGHLLIAGINMEPR